MTPLPAHIDTCLPPPSAERCGPDDVGSHPGDLSVDGVLDLAGNVMEWTASQGETKGIRIVRGANYDDSKRDMVHDYIALENWRFDRLREYTIGLRCAAQL